MNEPAKDPAERAAKAKEALGELEGLVAKQKWLEAGGCCGYIMGLLAQCRAWCEERTPKKGASSIRVEKSVVDAYNEDN